MNRPRAHAQRMSLPSSPAGRALGGSVVLAVVLVLGGCAPGEKGEASGGAEAPEASTAPWLSSPEAIALNNRGVGLMGYFDYPAARDTFADLVEMYPKWWDAQVNLAVATMNRQQEGDESRALSIVEGVLAQAPDNPRAHFVAGLLKLYVGEQDAALAHFRLVAEADPDDAYAAYYTGQLLSSQGQVQDALMWFERAMDRDPQLRSAYYGASIALRRLGQRAQAVEMQKAYLRLEANPRARLAEFKYTRMGPKADTKAVPVAGAAPAPPAAAPAGPVFERPVLLTGDWRPAPAATLTTADIDGDGRQDLFVSAVRHAPAAGGDDAATAQGLPVSLVLLQHGDGAGAVFAPSPDHILSGLTDVIAAAWADFDNDGLTDTYLCRGGADMLWYQRRDGPDGGAGVWRDRSSEAGVTLPDGPCRDVAVFDADHDGDVDVFVAGQDGNELLNNDDGTHFRAIAAEQGLRGRGGGRQVLAADFDADRDVDIAVINDEAPHSLFLNDRLWSYREFDAPGFTDRELAALVAGDVDADGLTDFHALAPAADGGASELVNFEWRDGAMREVGSAALGVPFAGLALQDFTGNGTPELLLQGREGVRLLSAGDPVDRDIPTAELEGDQPLVAALPVLVSVARGPGLAIARSDGIFWAAPGSGRYPFAAFSLAGRESAADAMRSNAAGIGTRLAIRRGSEWSITTSFDRQSAAGQSLQPLSIGTGAAATMDFIAVDWSDGVFQTELDLAAGERHRVVETQRQLASCPVLFAWNGSEHGFVTDLLGVGGIGFFLGPAEYSSPRPWERLLLPAGALAPRDGAFVLKLAEPMEEVAYIDHVALESVLVPPGWKVLVDERHATDPERPPTGALRWYRDARQPVEVVNERGERVTLALADADGKAAPPGAVDPRFLGRLAGTHQLTMRFDVPLSRRPRNAQPYLLADGWVEYPYSQTLFAAWQADVAYEPPSLEASVDGVTWTPVALAFGYPAGMPRQMALPLEGLAEGTQYLRLSTNLQIYWDRLQVAMVLPSPPDAAAVEHLPLDVARLAQVGFPKRLTLAQRRPEFRYDERAAFWDTRYQRGAYTMFGDVMPLVAARDDALALVGAGEELHLEFRASTRFEVPPGWQQRFVFSAFGWAKDMDMYTRTGETVAPMPHLSSREDVLTRRDELHSRFHLRPLSGK